MAEYRVHLSAISSYSVLVEAADEDEAIDQAFEEMSAGICAQCSGWRQKWSLELGESWEPESVDECETGKEVWRAKEHWHRQRSES